MKKLIKRFLSAMQALQINEDAVASLAAAGCVGIVEGVALQVTNAAMVAAKKRGMLVRMEACRKRVLRIHSPLRLFHVRSTRRTAPRRWAARWSTA